MRKYDRSGNVVCQLCDKSFKMITTKHLKKSHEGTTLKEYKMIFEYAPLSARKTLEFIKVDTIESLKEEQNEREEKIIEVKEELKSVENINKKITTRDELFFQIKKKFPDVIFGYHVLSRSLSGQVYLDFITDCAFLKKKVILLFSGSTWSLKDKREDVNKIFKLRKDGWIVIEFLEKHSTIKDVEDQLNRIF